MVYLLIAAIMAVIILTVAFVRRLSEKGNKNPAENNLQETVVAYAKKASVLEQKAIIVLLFEATHPGFVAHDSEFYEFYTCCMSFFEELYSEKSDKHDNNETDTETGNVPTDDFKEVKIKSEEKVIPVIKDLFLKRRQILLGELNSSKGALKGFQESISDFIQMIRNLSEVSNDIEVLLKSDIGEIFINNLIDVSKKLVYYQKIDEYDDDARAFIVRLKEISESEENPEKDYAGMIVLRWYKLCGSFRPKNTEETHISKTYHQVVEQTNAVLSRCTEFNAMLTDIDKVSALANIGIYIIPTKSS